MRWFGEHLCPRKTAPPLGCRLVGRGGEPHRFGRSQRRKLFTLFCRTAAACSYDPPKRRFGEHLCPRKTAPPLGRRLVGRGGDLTGSGGRNAANFLLCFAFSLRLARTTHRNGGSVNTSAHAKRHPLWGAVWWAEVETSQVRKVATPQTFYSILPYRCGLLVRTTETAVRRTPLPTQNGTPFGVPSGGQRWIRTTEVCDVRFTV